MYNNMQLLSRLLNQVHALTIKVLTLISSVIYYLFIRLPVKFLMWCGSFIFKRPQIKSKLTVSAPAPEYAKFDPARFKWRQKQYPGQNRKRLEGDYIEQWVVDQIPQNHNVNGAATPGGQILTHNIVIKSLDLQNANENELRKYRDIAPNAIVKTWKEGFRDNAPNAFPKKWKELDETDRFDIICEKLQKYEDEVKKSVHRRVDSGCEFYDALKKKYTILKHNKSPISQLNRTYLKKLTKLVLLEKDHQSNLPEHLGEYTSNWNNFNRECIRHLRNFESRLTDKCIDLGITIRDYGSSAEDWNLALINAANELTRPTQKFPLQHNKESSSFETVDKNNTRHQSRSPSR